MIKIEESDFCKTCKLVDMYNELEEKNKQLKGQLDTYKILLRVNLERIDKAIELLEKGITFCENDSQGIYEKCNISINREKKVLKILKGDSNE